MKKSLLALVLGVFLTMPCVLHAEEIEIELSEVISMEPTIIFPGDSPLDDPEPVGEGPTRPTNFRATINGQNLSISKLVNTIPYAQATVVNAVTGSIVVNQQFVYTLSHLITTPGVYILHITTPTGALVGQFVVQ